MRESSAWIQGLLPWTICAGLTACGQSAQRPEQPVHSRPEADSARLAHIALDSANRASQFISEVLRYEPHGDSIRIVTMPDQRHERLGAERLYSSEGEFHGGYGWRDLRYFIAITCSTN